MNILGSSFYVYIYRDLDNTPLYVGKGRGKRFRHYFYESNGKVLSGRNIHLVHKVRKVLRDSTCCLYPELIFVDSEEEAFDLEIYYIRKFGRADKNLGTLYNLSDGGEGTSGRIVSLEERIRLSAQNSKENHPQFGKPKPVGVREKISAALKGSNSPNFGKKLTEEQKAAISKRNLEMGLKPPSRKGVKASEETRRKQSLAKLGKPGSRTGTEVSPETREKLRQLKLGSSHPEEVKLKISKAHTGKKHSEQHRLNRTATRIGCKLIEVSPGVKKFIPPRDLHLYPGKYKP